MNVVVRLPPGARSVWDPCPLVTVVLHRALRASVDRREVPALILPLMPRWYRRSQGLSGTIALDPDQTEHPDRTHGEAVLQTAAAWAAATLARARRRLSLEIPRRHPSHADKRFLRALVERAAPEVLVEVREVDGARRPLRAPSSPPGDGRAAEQRAILAGVDKAMSVGLYLDARSRLRLGRMRARGDGARLYDLVDRLALVYAALQRPARAAACQRWLAEHAPTPLERLFALIALAVQRAGPRASASAQVEARRSLAAARLLERGLEDSADRTLARAMWLNARALLLFRIGARRAALARCEQACAAIAAADMSARFIGQLAVQCGNAGRLAIELGDMDLAKQWAERLARIAERYPPGLERGSKLLGRVGRWSEAARLIDEALARGDAHPRLRFHRALCRFHLGESAAALEDLDVVARAWPDNTAVPLLRATVLEAAGDLAGASAAYRDALRIDPNRVSAWVDLARLAWQRDSLPEAVSALERGVALAPAREDLKARLSQLRAEEHP